MRTIPFSLVLQLIFEELKGISVVPTPGIIRAVNESVHVRNVTVNQYLRRSVISGCFDRPEHISSIGPGSYCLKNFAKRVVAPEENGLINSTPLSRRPSCISSLRIAEHPP